MYRLKFASPLQIDFSSSVHPPAAAGGCSCHQVGSLPTENMELFRFPPFPFPEQNATVDRDSVLAGDEMNTNQMHEEIKEANLSYMLLARQMIQEDQAAAIFRLGISKEMADLIAGLSPAQLLKMAASNMLLCRFRFDEKLLLNMITDYNKDRMMSQAHTTILMTGRPMEVLAA